MTIIDDLGERIVARHIVDHGDLAVPIFEQGEGNYVLAAAGADLPGSRLPNANVRVFNADFSAIIGEAIVRGDVRGFIVEAWSEGDVAAISLNASVTKLIEIERQNGNPDFTEVDA